MWKEFKKFVVRGNVMDLAIGVILGGAFSAIVTSLVNDIIMPPIGLLLGRVDFGDLFIDLTGSGFETLAAAQEAGAATINYGLFVNTVVRFLIVAWVIFIVVRQLNRLKRAGEEAPPAPTTKTCPHCYTEIHLKAVRCPNCTSSLQDG